MTYELHLLSCAEEDISNAIIWYDKQLKGLGQRFLLSIDASIQSIQRNPFLYPKIYKNFRRALIQRFPFGIYYSIERDTIVVIAAFHEKRKPKRWKKRIE